jgi:L-cysteine/cystine lyase
MIDIKKHREQFAGLQNKYYFNFGGQGVLADATLAKIVESYHYLENIGAFSIQANQWIYDNIYSLKTILAHEFNGTAKTIALTENVTYGCNIVLWGIEWEAGDEILLTDAEHPGIIGIVKEISRRFGVKIKTCPIIDTLNQGNPSEVIKNHLTLKTRLVVISHILWNTGQVLPLSEIANICHSNPAQKTTQLLVDGAQTAGSLPLDLISSNVDYYACTGHKWLCGASGLGFLYIRDDLLTSLHPTYIGWRGLNCYQEDLPFYPDGRRYEVATSAYPLIAGLQTAIAVHQQWGNVTQRYQRICQLSAYLWQNLQNIDGVKSLKNTPPQSGLVSFYPPESKNPQKIVQNLQKTGFYLRTLANPLCIRACVHYFTLEEEIDSLIKAIKLEL